MKPPSLQQIRSASAVVECGFSVSRAARILNTSQPAVSKTLKALEEDLGTPVFLRSSGRIVGLTEFGQDILGFVRGILHYSTAVLERAREKQHESRDTIRIGTNHIYSRYSLPGAIQQYLTAHPGASVRVYQGEPEQVAQWVALGRVQIGISTLLGEASVGVLAVPAFSAERCIITPRGHELLACKKPTMADLAKYPLVSYNEVLNATDEMQHLFLARGISKNVMVEATDADVIKAYVRAGLGIAIVQRLCIEPEDDRLGVIDASHLFPPAIAYVILRRDRNLRSGAHDFIEQFAPQWTKQALVDVEAS
jgi:LysR family cys regulon transcriptional activator